MRSEAKARSLELAEGEEVRVGGAKQRDGEKRGGGGGGCGGRGGDKEKPGVS